MADASLSPLARRFIAVCSIIGAIVGVTAVNPSIRLAVFKRVWPDKVVRLTADELNERLPMTVDDFTRWERCEALPNVTLQYCYTILKADHPDRDSLVEAVTPQLTDLYRTSDDMKTLRDINATLLYKYSDEAGREIATITISPETL
jgi:hypothetical protein